MKGDHDFKFCDIVSADSGISMMAMFGGGSSARIENPSWYFKIIIVLTQ